MRPMSLEMARSLLNAKPSSVEVSISIQFSGLTDKKAHLTEQKLNALWFK